MILELQKINADIASAAQARNKKAAEQLSQYVRARDVLQRQVEDLKIENDLCFDFLKHLDYSKTAKLDLVVEGVQKEFGKIFTDLTGGFEGKLIYDKEKGLL